MSVILRISLVESRFYIQSASKVLYLFPSLKPVFTSHTPSRSHEGSSLVEVMIAGAIIALTFSGIFMMNGRSANVLRTGLESMAAVRVLNGRAEQLRSSTYTQLTDTNYLTNTVFAVAPDSGGDLGQLTETLNIFTYPTAGTAMSLTRQADGTVALVSSGPASLTTSTSLRIDLTADWVSKGGRPRTRQMTLIFASGGITGRH
jgi:hypothetical protein